jgi:hypothetical protein
MMNRNILVATTLCALIAGCISPYVKGEKLGPGHCRQSGVVEISIQNFQRSPNATLTIKIQSLEQKTKDSNYEPIGNFAWLGIVGNDGISKNYSESYWNDNREHNWLEPNETDAIYWKIPDFPNAPWREIQVSYVYSKGSRDYPTSMHCSLEGDNAPWAFETKA